MLGDGGFPVAVRRVFVVQGAAVWLVSLPIQAAAVTDVEWAWACVLGIVVWAVGLVFEVVGDRQLAAYRARPRDQRPPVLDTGLWAWTRHPHYFGDACVWWGIWLTGAVSAGWLPALVTLVAPVTMTHFLRNVTGAKLVERTMSTRPGWDEYAARVPLFVPRPPRRLVHIDLAGDPPPAAASSAGTRYDPQAGRSTCSASRCAAPRGSRSR